MSTLTEAAYCGSPTPPQSGCGDGPPREGGGPQPPVASGPDANHRQSPPTAGRSALLPSSSPLLYGPVAPRPPPLPISTLVHDRILCAFAPRAPLSRLPPVRLCQPACGRHWRRLSGRPPPRRRRPPPPPIPGGSLPPAPVGHCQWRQRQRGGVRGGRRLESRIKPSTYTAYAPATVDGVASAPKSRTAFAMSRRRAAAGGPGSATADALRAAGVAGVAAIAAAVLQHGWVESHLQLTLAAIVALGYAGTLAETALDTSKTGLALLTAVGVWTAAATAGGATAGGLDAVAAALGTHLAGTAELVVFLISAATVTELIAAHGGFRPLARVVAAGTRRSPTAAVAAVGAVAFGLSALADNLTATLPPFLGMTAAAGGMWLLTDCLHGRRPGRGGLRAGAAVARVDVSSLLFITGALLLVGGLDEAGLLRTAAAATDAAGVPPWVAAVAAGAASSVVDNVPLVAAVSAVWGGAVPPDDAVWHLVCLAAGTGASMLPMGSVAGVALMALEGVPLGWYVRHVTGAAAAGYVAGLAAFWVMTAGAASMGLGG
ncbi:hypothetical protein BU14_0441s0002 [Porphyra umbilicalis]|uniref:Citrate transporter-like domain-containing protein n=1 Tax=Porphyra umbilicalis TaxID=2786 RepID=A0A1X6NVJ3_PORUM|nr:hypothetical protein BU14_0441s0002 [Porphyra umbilicalis]|eukprot:OSX72393.1 hypothetical protein BU14_0441s0002 [Porphyra umbilicalis]